MTGKTSSIIQSRMMSVCPSVYLSLKISVTTEPIEFYSSWNIPTGPVLVFGHLLGGWTPPNHPKKNKKKTKFKKNMFEISGCISNFL